MFGVILCGFLFYLGGITIASLEVSTITRTTPQVWNMTMTSRFVFCYQLSPTVSLLSPRKMEVTEISIAYFLNSYFALLYICTWIHLTYILKYGFMFLTKPTAIFLTSHHPAPPANSLSIDHYQSHKKPRQAHHMHERVNPNSKTIALQISNTNSDFKPKNKLHGLWIYFDQIQPGNLS